MPANYYQIMLLLHHEAQGKHKELWWLSIIQWKIEDFDFCDWNILQNRPFALSITVKKQISSFGTQLTNNSFKILPNDGLL